ncbi:MAG: hypothetical protein CL760_00880 [Chloroflexi bacterium]|nr:hypothetical protein [Chloroflexota bacterium]|tara:strand:+ start:33399 stop:33959 length:561 start_codon:yes stop_codon:yes gene_type:complete
MSILSNQKINIEKSQKIFNDLVKGKVINELIYDPKTDALVINDLFSEVRDNLEQYKLQYQMNGMELVEKAKYFYLIDKSKNSETKQPIKTKVYASMILLVRFVMSDGGKVFDYLKNINYGVSVKDLDGIEDNPNYLHILKTAKIDKAKNILKYLYEKNILLKTSKDRYILSDSGNAIIQDIINGNN